MEAGTAAIKIHFISGLPRSGSTLLSAVLRQNPAFQAGTLSPLVALFAAMLPVMSTGEFGSRFTDQQREDVLRGLFHSYHGKRSEADRVIFDSNRLWTTVVPLLSRLFPQALVICCVRDMGEVLGSLLRAQSSLPLRQPQFGAAIGETLEERAAKWLRVDGLVGGPWHGLRQAWFGPCKQRLALVEYSALTSNPRGTVERLYRELGEAPFTHDFENLSFEDAALDEAIGSPGLHRVRGPVRAAERYPIPALGILKEFPNFWR
jgi:sulfotransferase